ncbi:hypothetical protein V5O48_004889 [Marasmius crinis-equi]|uniref:tRNA(Ile)-lysidine/2-thiocytidine synthase N-terminal domain-containing protein n=1 Tax=Marasmius crinis-equi TaxID=585013 RepID=A0ABR3FNT2_9AGAR
MAKKCADITQRLGLEHHTHNVAWGQDGIQARPRPTNPTLEYSARIARYRTFNAAMTALKAKVLVLGHHLDDQVETSVMRILKHSTDEGAGGMKYVRRWGMGFGHQAPNEHFGWTAYEGMRMWIVRPLLEFPKPRLTVRNAIRKWLNDKGNQSEEDPFKLPLENLEGDLARFESEVASVDLSGGLDQLYGAVMALNNNASDIERQVDSILSRCSLRSPPGTYLTTSSAISSVRDRKIQRAIVLRILRYLSFHPWGSLQAQLKRRNLGLTQIATKLWNPNPLSPLVPEFCAGGGVQWIPVVIRGTTIRFPPDREHAPLNLGESAGWLAFRQVPPKIRSPIYQKKGIEDRLNIRVTSLLAAHLDTGEKKLEYLYDCRFLVTFDLTTMPEEILRVLREPEEGEHLWLMPHSKWIWPRLVWKRPGHEDVVLHSKVALKNPTPSSDNFDDQLNLLSKPEIGWRKTPMEEAPWVKAEFVRALSSH